MTKRNYVCDCCKKKGFGSLQDLLEHVQARHNPKPFKCCYCPKAYSNRTGKVRHMTLKHTEEHAAAEKNKGGREQGQTKESGKLTIWQQITLRIPGEPIGYVFNETHDKYMYRDPKTKVQGLTPQQLVNQCKRPPIVKSEVHPRTGLEYNNFTDSSIVENARGMLDDALKAAVEDPAVKRAVLDSVRRRLNVQFDEIDEALKNEESPDEGTGSHILEQLQAQSLYSSVLHSSQENDIPVPTPAFFEQVVYNSPLHQVMPSAYSASSSELTPSPFVPKDRLPGKYFDKAPATMVNLMAALRKDLGKKRMQ